MLIHESTNGSYADERAAATWLETYVGALDDALREVMWVETFEPIIIPAEASSLA